MRTSRQVPFYGVKPLNIVVSGMSCVLPASSVGEGARRLAGTIDAAHPPEVLTEDPVTAAERLTAARIRGKGSVPPRGDSDPRD